MIGAIIIHPGATKTIYGDLGEQQTALEPPTWARMIAGWLKDHGYSIRIIDQEAENLSVEDITRRIEEISPRLVVVVVAGHQPSASTQQMVGARALLEAITATTIIVGNHPSALPKRTLIEEPADYACDGEGPYTIAGLLENMPKETIPGLVWRDGEEIIVNPTAQLIDIDELHGDVWDLLPMDKYRAHTWQCLDGSQRQPYASIYTTLGCPYKCHFCMINTFQHSNIYRRRSPEKVIEQIKTLYEEYGVSTFKIADEMFILDPRHYMPICEGLAQLPFADELNIWAYARIDTIKPAILDVLYRGGIRWLALGIESGAAHIRDGAMKTLKDNDIRAIVNTIQDAGINVIGNFIFGLPDDTRKTMKSTLNLAKTLKLDFANFYSAMAYPGSKLFDEADPRDLPDSWSGYSQHSEDCKPLPTKTLTSEEVLRFRDKAFNDFFTDVIYLERIRRKFGPHGQDTIIDMTKHKMQRNVA